MKKQVAVLGGGVSGLISAKELLASGFRVVLFESRGYLGGAWKGKQTDASGFPSMWKTLRPNLSKYTCTFPGFPWFNGIQSFPSILDFSQYIDSFTEQYVVNHDSCQVMLNSSVEKVERINDSNTEKFKVRWSTGSNVSLDIFDGVVVATGYHSKAVYPKCILDLKDKKQVLHSSYFHDPNEFTDLNVAVIGGSFSGHEVASSVAGFAKSVVNVAGNSNFYILPRYLPSSSGNFVPNDLVFYQRQNDGLTEEPLTIFSEEDCSLRHKFLQSLLGKRRIDQLVDMGYEYEKPSFPHFITISDMYFNLVQSGIISFKKQRLTGCYANEHNKLTLVLDNEEKIENIDKVICCTGYKSDLSFLNVDILEELGYNAEDSFLPMTTVLDVYHPKIQGLGFVGMYRGPFFGIKYLQIKLFIEQCLRGQKLLSKEEENHQLQQTSLIRNSSPRAQFPRVDYPGICDYLAGKLNHVPPEQLTQAGEVCVPQFFTSKPDLVQQTNIEIMAQQENNEFNTRAIFEGLIGKWSFTRVIEDSLEGGYNSVKGKASFTILLQDEGYYIRYHEVGEFNRQGQILEVSKSYDYVLLEDRIDLYFVENNKRKGFFLSLLFNYDDNGCWASRGSEHLCINDLYKNDCIVQMDGLSIQHFEMTYSVTGPKKSYKSTTFYE